MSEQICWYMQCTLLAQTVAQPFVHYLNLLLAEGNTAHSRSTLITQIKAEATCIMGLLLLDSFHKCAELCFPPCGNFVYSPLASHLRPQVAHY